MQPRTFFDLRGSEAPRTVVSDACGFTCNGLRCGYRSATVMCLQWGCLVCQLVNGGCIDCVLSIGIPWWKGQFPIVLPSWALHAPSVNAFPSVFLSGMQRQEVESLYKGLVVVCKLVWWGVFRVFFLDSSSTAWTLLVGWLIMVCFVPCHAWQEKVSDRSQWWELFDWLPKLLSQAATLGSVRGSECCCCPMCDCWCSICIYWFCNKWTSFLSTCPTHWFMVLLLACSSAGAACLVNMLVGLVISAVLFRLKFCWLLCGVILMPEYCSFISSITIPFVIPFLL